MKKLILFFFLLISISAQSNKMVLIGESTYESSQFTYVRFSGNFNLSIGDTLFYQNNNDKIAGLVIKHLSSSSAACLRINDITSFKEGTSFYGYDRKIETAKENNDLKIEDNKPVIKTTDTFTNDSKTISNKISNEENISGRFSISSYSNTTNSGSNNYQRWRYRLSLNGNNFFDSTLSFSSYVTFAYRADRWNLTSSQLNRAIRIYDLSGTYKFDETYSLTFGRTVNSKVTNLSAIDGLQFTANYSFANLGVIIGSRPNFTDYGYNVKLFEYGFYLNRSDLFNNSYFENTLAYLEQTNNFKTDRRFLYLQHSNNLVKNVNLFLSSEIDIYKREKGSSKGDFRFTSFYVSARYSPSRIINFSASYDARKNVVYYETYQSFADSLIDVSTRQGFKFRTNIRPFPNMYINASYGYRYRGEDSKPTNNYSATVGYSRIPFIESALSVGYNYLSTNYLVGNIYNARISKYIFEGSLNTSLGYRRINYNFEYSTEELIQNEILFDLGYNISKMFTASFSYEGTFEKVRSYGRIYININTRF